MKRINIRGSLPGRVKIYEFMKDKLESRGDRIVVYLNGWDDEKVTEFMSKAMPDENVTVAIVSNVRKECFGHLQKASMVAGSTIEALANRLGLLEAENDDFRVRLERLELLWGKS